MFFFSVLLFIVCLCNINCFNVYRNKLDNSLYKSSNYNLYNANTNDTNETNNTNLIQPIVHVNPPSYDSINIE